MRNPYIKPDTKIIEVKQTTPLMQVSQLGVAGGTLDAGQALSKGDSFWSFEEEEGAESSNDNNNWDDYDFEEEASTGW